MSDLRGAHRGQHCGHAPKCIGVDPPDDRDPFGCCNCGTRELENNPGTSARQQGGGTYNMNDVKIPQDVRDRMESALKANHADIERTMLEGVKLQSEAADLGLAEELFNAYNEEGPNPWKTFDGRDVPRWDAINDQVRAKWTAVARTARAMFGGGR